MSPKADASLPARPAPGVLANPYLQLALSVVLTAAAQLFLKRGAGAALDAGWLGLAAVRSPWVWCGMAALIVSLLSWLYALRFVPLGFACNLSGAIHVLVPVGCWMWLGEAISGRRCLGILLVAAGVIVSARPASAVERRL